MRKQFLLTLMISFLAVSAWGTDVSVTERFSDYSTNWTTVANGDWNGDICQWNVYQVRRKAADNTDLINGALANFLKYDKKNSKWSYITTTNWEGGIKAVSFKYARFGSEYPSGLVVNQKQ